MTNINMTAVTTFFNDYHTAVASKSDLYVNSNDQFTIVLPQELLEFAEAGAGHSGFGTGARPVGIRRTSVNAKNEVTVIFSTVETLAKFILTSKKNADNDALSARKNNVTTTVVKMNNTEARKVFWDKADKAKYDEMTVKYGKKTVDNDLMTLTWNEFDLRYGFVTI